MHIYCYLAESTLHHWDATLGHSLADRLISGRLVPSGLAMPLLSFLAWPLLLQARERCDAPGTAVSFDAVGGWRR